MLGESDVPSALALVAGLPYNVRRVTYLENEVEVNVPNTAPHSQAQERSSGYTERQSDHQTQAKPNQLQLMNFTDFDIDASKHNC